MFTIHGELDTGHQQIVLVAGGPDEAVAEAAKRLQTLTPLIQRSNPPGALVLPVSWPAVVQLAHTFGDAWRPGPRLTAWTAEQVRRRTQPADGPLSFRLPDELTPRPYQMQGAKLIAQTGRALLFDDPGTGKTITAILGLRELEHLRAVRQDDPDGHLLPVIVVCPASVVDHWVEAFTMWAPHWQAVAWRGTPKQRHALVDTADVYVTSYDTARSDAPAGGSLKRSPLLQLRARALVVDECHLIKNQHAQRSLAVRRIARQTTDFVGLSGTPITHHPGDLWPTLTALGQHAWPSSERWSSRYLLTVAGDYDRTVLGLSPVAEPEFRLTLLGQHRRVAKADVLAQLPPKVYSVRTVELPLQWRAAYDKFESEMLAELPDEGGELSVMSVLAQLTHLSALASAAADVEVTVEQNADDIDVEHVHLDLRAPSWKVDALLDALDERPDESVVVFAERRDLVRLAGEAAAREGRRVGYILGGQSMTERTTTVRAFQNGELDLICATTRAGGVGLTLTAARTVVFLQRPFSLVDALQAEDRCHRIGSEIHDSIEVIDVVASNTIDTRVRSVLRQKGKQLADLVQDPRIVAELLGGASVTKLKKAS